MQKKVPVEITRSLTTNQIKFMTIITRGLCVKLDDKKSARQNHMKLILDFKGKKITQHLFMRIFIYVYEPLQYIFFFH